MTSFNEDMIWRTVPGKNKAVRGRAVFDDACRTLCCVLKKGSYIGRGRQGFTASSTRAFSRIEELYGFGKPVAKRFISRSSSCEILNGMDGSDDDFLEFSLWIVLIVSNLNYCESQLGKAGEPSFRIFSPQNETLGGKVHPPFIRLNAGLENDFH
jgi:hypothetical protein